MNHNIVDYNFKRWLIWVWIEDEGMKIDMSIWISGRLVNAVQWMACKSHLKMTASVKAAQGVVKRENFPCQTVHQLSQFSLISIGSIFNRVQLRLQKAVDCSIYLFVKWFMNWSSLLFAIISQCRQDMVWPEVILYVWIAVSAGTTNK